jgi:hypothetical protein
MNYSYYSGCTVKNSEVESQMAVENSNRYTTQVLTRSPAPETNMMEIEAPAPEMRGKVAMKILPI